MSEAPEMASVLEVLGARRDDLRISQELIEVLLADDWHDQVTDDEKMH